MHLNLVPNSRPAGACGGRGRICRNIRPSGLKCQRHSQNSVKLSLKPVSNVASTDKSFFMQFEADL
jgi:hypothetical protein